MATLKRKYLLGATKDGELAFAEFELREQGDSPESKRYTFSASFDTVRPFNVDDIDEDYVQDTILDNMEDGELYRLCERYDCAPSALASEFYSNTELEDLVDMSLYPDTITVNGTTFGFESSGCGQQDLLEDMEEYVNYMGFSLLYMLWKQYHLKNLNGKDLTVINEMIDKITDLFEDIDESCWIADYISQQWHLLVL